MTEPTLNSADFQAPPQIDTLQKVGLGLGLLGIIGLAVGFASDPAQFYKSYLLAYVFVLGRQAHQRGVTGDLDARYLEDRVATAA